MCGVSMIRTIAWGFFTAALAVIMVVLLGVTVVPADNAQAEVCTGWSDNFNGGAQQTWVDIDGGTNSSFKFQNNRYEMHTECDADSTAYLVSGVNSGGTDYEIQARIQRITTGDDFVVDLLARGDVPIKRCYALGTSSCGCVLNLFKYLPGGASSTLIATTPVSFDSGDFKLKLRVSGTSLSGKVWSGDTEPGWQISCTDASYASGVGGIELYKPPYPLFPPGITTVQVAFDDVSMTCLPQMVIPTPELIPTLPPPNPLIGTGAPTSRGSSGAGTTTTTQPVSLPNIQIQGASLSAKTVTPGMPVTVTAAIINKGTVNGNKKVTLYVNGQVETAQGVTVNSGGSSKLTFYVSRSDPGNYSVFVDGVPAGSFKVEMVTGNEGILIFSIALIALAFVAGMVMLWRRQQRTGRY